MISPPARLRASKAVRPRCPTRCALGLAALFSRLYEGGTAVLVSKSALAGGRRTDLKCVEFDGRRGVRCGFAALPPLRALPAAVRCLCSLQTTAVLFRCFINLCVLFCAGRCSCVL